MLSCVIVVVIDTNVVVAALRSEGGASRQVVRGCLQGAYEPLVGAALLAEYEHTLLGRALAGTSVTREERYEVMAALTAVGRWVSIYYLWRPNLSDETDNHLIELAVAGGAEAIVTHNTRDLRSGELLFPSVKILTPAAFLKEYPCPP